MAPHLLSPSPLTATCPVFIDFQQDFSVAAATNSWWLFSVPCYQLSGPLPYISRKGITIHKPLFATIAGSSGSNAIWG